MPVSPPLDMIPQIPGKLITILSIEANKLIKTIAENVGESLSDVMQLPDDIDCNDPRIQALKDKLAKIQEMMGKIQKVIEIIQKINDALALASKIAAAIKLATFAIPVVGQAALMAELVVVQNMLIANAIQAVKGLDVIPPLMDAGMSLVNKQLAQIINKLSGVCDDETFGTTKQVQQEILGLTGDLTGDTTHGGILSDSNWRLISGSRECGEPIGRPPTTPSPHTDTCGSVWIWAGAGYYNPDGISWGSKQSRIDDATMGTEVYTDINVSTSDLDHYMHLVEKLVANQEDLLSSVQEAPAQSYSGTTAPDISMGKSGDYYMDTVSRKMYGPKNIDGWPTPINY